MFASLLKTCSLLILLASAAQGFSTASEPVSTSVLGDSNIASPFPGALACGDRGDPHTILLYYTTQDGNMRVRKAERKDGRKYEFNWGPVVNMGGPFQPYTPAAIEYKGKAMIVQIGLDQVPKYVTYDSAEGSYGNWVPLGGLSQTAPGVAYLQGRDEVVVVVRGLEGAYFYYVGTPDTKFSSFVKLDGIYTYAPQLATLCDSQGKEYLLVVGPGQDNVLYSLTYTDGKWSTFNNMQFGEASGYAMVRLSPSGYDSQLKCYRTATLITTSNNGNARKTTYNGSWNTLVEFGYSVPPQFCPIDLRNGTNAYFTNSDKKAAVSSYGDSLCGNHY